MTIRKSIAAVLAALVCVCVAAAAFAAGELEPLVAPELRGRIDAERQGLHDANNIRTIFHNWGMVGGYPSDPINVDLSVFHSAEAPKGSGMNYSDGITPFVLAKIRQTDGTDSYLMETGYRERQCNDPLNRTMRFEPRPGFFQPDPTINKARSPAISHDPRTWPDAWPDKADDPDDAGWAGSWNGYFGKRPAADQESFTVMDDDFYSTWRFNPDSRDLTRRGLGLRVETRGFQWANPQAGNVIFWHYDITNEGTTDYDDNIIFGIYMDSGVGGSAISCDGLAESDDDNAYFDKSFGMNLVYTWDTYGHGKSLDGSCARTGYMGYAYLETPGNAIDAVDNDDDGMLNERRDGGVGTLITGQDAIRAYVESHYDTTKWFRAFGRYEKHAAYRLARWYTGDEDMDWNAELDDVGADGVPETGDTGELDGIPTLGEPNFDKTDVSESDQIGLTGFKMNLITATTDHPEFLHNVLFCDFDGKNWPLILYDTFTNPVTQARFDSTLAANYNIGFLFASGPFTLKAGQRERFSLALAYGSTLNELRAAVQTVQQIYDANYQFAVPPTRPTVTAEAGDGYVRLSWDDVAERSIDPVNHDFDFEGYRIYRSTDPDFRDVQKVYNGQGTQPVGNGQPTYQMDLDNQYAGYSRMAVSGVQYWLGENNGIRHTWTDTTAVNGMQYYYAVCAYDHGFDTGADSTSFYPSENSIPVSRTARGGLILPSNVVAVRPNPRVGGWTAATVTPATHATGRGLGNVGMEVVNSDVVPDGHLMTITFTTDSPDSIRAMRYVFRDSTAHVTWFKTGADFDSSGTGPVGAGLLPYVRKSAKDVIVRTDSTGWTATSTTNARFLVNDLFTPTLSPNLRRVGYPDDISIVFDNVVRDTGVTGISGSDRANPAKFYVVAHTPTGDQRLKFRFRDAGRDGTINAAADYIEIETKAPWAPNTYQPTWRITLDPTAVVAPDTLARPNLGDVWNLRLSTTLGVADTFTFVTGAQGVNHAGAQAAWNQKPYVVPNPYVAAASFEPQRFNVSGRGDRRMEFRAIPQGGVIRIYTVHGDLVQTLRQDGSVNGYVPWDLRTKDNLDVAPGLYVFHVDAPSLGTYIGKFAIIK